jgi:hypothetical protein
MKTKTSNLIERFLKEELNTMQPMQGQVPMQGQPQVPTQQNPQSNNQTNTNNNQEEKQRVEVYLPLHNGRFTNRIFSTSKDINIKVLYDNIEDDMRIMQEIENNPDTYHQIEPQEPNNSVKSV